MSPKDRVKAKEWAIRNPDVMITCSHSSDSNTAKATRFNFWNDAEWYTVNGIPLMSIINKKERLLRNLETIC